MVWRLSSVCSYRATRNQLIEFPIVENPEFWKLFNFNCETSARLGGQGQTLTAGAQSNLKYQKCWEDYRRVGGCGQGYITVPVCVSKIRCRPDWVIRGRHCCTISNLWEDGAWDTFADVGLWGQGRQPGQLSRHHPRADTRHSREKVKFCQFMKSN